MKENDECHVEELEIRKSNFMPNSRKIENEYLILSGKIEYKLN